MDMAKFNKDKHFEERLVQALLIDHKFAEQMVEVLDTDYFNYDHLRETATIIFSKLKPTHSMETLGTSKILRLISAKKEA
jgi:hypothetical protein